MGTKIIEKTFKIADRKAMQKVLLEGNFLYANMYLGEKISNILPILVLVIKIEELNTKEVLVKVETLNYDDLDNITESMSLYSCF
jgi:hypothetical protein